MLSLLISTATTVAHERERSVAASFDILIYGSTPSGIIAAVASARHLTKAAHAGVALLSQRQHIGGVCSGGLGQTDVGSCANQTIGGIPLEFFQRTAANYATPQPRAPWNLEPHVAEATFRAMLREANVKILPYDEVASVQTKAPAAAEGSAPQITSITTVRGGATYAASVFIDASYEGDLMARTKNVAWTVGREGAAHYNETGAGTTSNNAYNDAFIDPLVHDGAAEPRVLPLVSATPPALPDGTADAEVQAYNFRLCVTQGDPKNLSGTRASFTKPEGYDPARWELLRRFWRDTWPNSTSPHRAAQAKVPTAILGRIPNRNGAWPKYDMNNCGYNPIHTDMIGGSKQYPTANYSERVAIWNAHVDYTLGFLWFMSSDAAVPGEIRAQYRDDWGFCGDEFPLKKSEGEAAGNGGNGGNGVESPSPRAVAHFPPQLYIREARRLVGDAVFTQNDVVRRTSMGNAAAIGMGCYNFDSHCEERYACDPIADPKRCNKFNRTYLAVECGVGGTPNPGIYQMPLSLLLPQKTQVSNLLVPVCSSASHVAYATVRMEPQFMILGHAAGVVAALALRGEPQVAVQDVQAEVIHATLVADGALLTLPPPTSPWGYACVGATPSSSVCALAEGSSARKQNATCDSKCAPLSPTTWLLLKEHWHVAVNGTTATVTASAGTFLKKSEARSSSLPPNATRSVAFGASLQFTLPLKAVDADYWVGDMRVR